MRLPPSSRTLELLDEISNSLCSMIDVAEICKHIHPDPSWREAAQSASSALTAHMSNLNHNHDLYTALSAIIALPDFKNWSIEQQRAATLLHRDMETNGIGLDAAVRSKVNALLEEVHQQTNQFMMAAHGRPMDHPHAWMILTAFCDPSEVLPHLGEFRSVARLNGGRIVLPIAAADYCLKNLPSSALRREVYIAHHSPHRLAVQEAAVERIVACRQQIARILGRENFAQHHTAQCIAGSTQHVRTFLTKILQGLQEKNSTKSAREVRELKKLKCDSERSIYGQLPLPPLAQLTAEQLAEVDATQLHPWDAQFLMGRLKASRISPALLHTMRDYFSVPNVIEGYKLLARELFGVELRQVEPHEHEDWTACLRQRGSAIDRVDDEVRKLELWEGDKMIGVIYLDLYRRPDKYSHAATFTVRNARQTFWIPDDAKGMDSPDISEEERQRLREERAKNPLPRQLAVAGIVCGLTRPSSSTSPTLLHQAEVEMLFHEFAHCLHNVLSSTALQHISGARGELDYVEMPSTLFEHFVSSYEFVRRWATHHDTTGKRAGRVLPKQLMEELIQSKRGCETTEMRQQALMAMFDQMVYGPDNVPKDVQQQKQEGSASEITELDPKEADAMGERMHKIHSELYAAYAPFKLPPGDQLAAATKPYLHSIHLLSYPSSYYCYLYCRVFSSRLWSDLFSRSPLSRSSGSLLRHELFAVGAGRDPVEILRRIVRLPPDASLQQFVEQQVQPFINKQQREVSEVEERIDRLQHEKLGTTQRDAASIGS